MRGDCDAIVGANANPDNAFSGENTHFKETSPLKEDQVLHHLTILCIQKSEKCCPNILYGGVKTEGAVV